tara:strand:+ start:905 stop:1150 length:246 start_codon:yes stop_codon:yes gene_type:complete
MTGHYQIGESYTMKNMENMRALVFLLVKTAETMFLVIRINGIPINLQLEMQLIIRRVFKDAYTQAHNSNAQAIEVDFLVVF